jgi:Ca2+-binding EF-hand superfamily protein
MRISNSEPRELFKGELGIPFRTFRIFDDDGSKSLDFSEFQKGVRDYGVMLTEDEEKNLFKKFDKDGNGKMSFDEFLNEVRVSCNYSA